MMLFCRHICPREKVRKAVLGRRLQWPRRRRCRLPFIPSLRGRTCLSVHPSVRPCVLPPMRPSVPACVRAHPSMGAVNVSQEFVHDSVCLSVCQLVLPAVRARLSVRLSARACVPVCWRAHPSLCSSVSTTTCLSVRPSVFPSVRPCARLFVHAQTPVAFYLLET